MKYFALVHPGLEKLVQQEIKELVNIKSKISPAIVEWESTEFKLVIDLLYHQQTARKILLWLGKNADYKKIIFSSLNFGDYFFPGCKFKVEVENVHGQDLRSEISKTISEALFKEFKKINLSPEIEFKHPDIIVFVYFNGEEYFVGLDLSGKELHKRFYRVFAHQASFTGDIAYFFVRKIGYKPQDKILVGLCKDGTLAIETALWASHLPVQKKPFSCQKFPLRKDWPELDSKPAILKIFGFDISQSNIIAARKNALIAGVKDMLELQKYNLDELDVKYDENYFNSAIFHLTTKDEEKINELYYQVNYLLKSKGKLLIIARQSFSLPISEKFKLAEEGNLQRGDSIHHWWLLEKK